MPLLGRLARFADFGLLVMRVGLGAMMITHGYPKLIAGPAKWKALGGAMANLGIHDFPTFWGFMGGFAEGVCGLLVVIGLFFRPACALIVFTMIVAALSHFGKGDGLQGAGHAIDLALAFFGMMFVGPGRFSIDRR